MRNNIYLILILVFVINACNALTSDTIKSVKTIPSTKISLQQIENGEAFTTVLTNNYVPNKTLTFLNDVASATMTCKPPKGLQKRTTMITKTLPSKTIPNIISTSSETPTTSTSEITLGTYGLYERIQGLTICDIYTLKYPVATTTMIYATTTTYKPFYTNIKYSVQIGNQKTTRIINETTSYGYTTSSTGKAVMYIKTARNHAIDNPPTMTCSTTESYVSKIPYISTKSYETPIASEMTVYNYQTQIRSIVTVFKSKEYVTLYSSGTMTSTNCELSFKTSNPLPVVTYLEQPVIITTTTTTTTTKKIPDNINTTTTTTTATTTTTKQIPINTTTTTTTTTKQLPVTTTTTTTTKQLPVTTTTTTTTKQPPITTKCLPITITVTEKEKIIVTEKETITVTIKSEPTNKVDCAKKWGQCGGVGFSGPTCCESGSVCKEHNQYYSQCI